MGSDAVEQVMRSAAILGHVAVPKIENLPRIKEFAVPLSGCVEACGFDILIPIFDDAYHFDLYATLWVGPHTDNIVGDITLGVVIEGDHYLFTGNGRKVGDLAPGTVFALLNKKLHGAYANDMKNPKPLIFAACEPRVPAEDWRGFCSKVSMNLQKLT